ncbi:MAG: SIMPL domain-containing protein [Nostoc sp. EfeVER01]|uniref:SIMPL domain-containing protein n=1 Tax=unclassified Nostoc TaxID=2593658 RepID=UPI002AD4B009|nr:MULTISPECIES: SIMPL domain-containing protein [unclassified Nostoc]MDZ7947399.1 SIMPL domain-containing protein [Nostoc sp. EfeVER01]MDZ7993294.1 SIMPL domain-containing protein [Nostoc sp. EspVER01]
MAGTNNLTGVRNPGLAIADPLIGSTDAKTPQILEVTGQGEVSVATTLTDVELGIKVQGKTATEVQEQVAQRSTAVVDALQKLGAKELQTTSIQLNPVYSYENGTQTLTGFEGLNTLQFELPTNQAGAAIDKAIQAGANVIQNISFSASDEVLQQARLQVLSEAVKDAKAQAQAVFSTLQLTPGQIIDIDINSDDNPRPSPLVSNLTADKVSAAASTTPIIGGSQTIEASVSLDISYSPNSAGTLASATDNLIGVRNLGLAIADPLIGSTAQILEVTGKGEVSVATTLTEVQLGIKVEGKTATEVQEQVAQRSTAVVDVLQKLGAKELQTTSIQLNPVYSYENGTQTLTGFEGLNTLQFELPTNQSGAAIDKAIQAGANVIQNISFTASDEVLQQARLQVLSEAVKDAKAQAQAVFSTLQLTPGQIIDIDINSDDNPTLSPFVSNLITDRVSTTPIIGGSQTIKASVSLDIGYSPNSGVILDLPLNGLQQIA